MPETAAPAPRAARRREAHSVPSCRWPKRRSRRRPCARTPSPAPQNIAREPRWERRRRARPGFLPRSGSRPRARLRLAAAALGAGRAGCWPCEPGFESSNPGLQDLILIASGGGHGLHRFELVAADEVLAAHPLAHLLARAGLGFTPHAGHRSSKAVHHLHQVVEHLVLGLHRNSSSFRAEIGICGSVRHPASRDYPQLLEISPDIVAAIPIAIRRLRD